MSTPFASLLAMAQSQTKRSQNIVDKTIEERKKQKEIEERKVSLLLV
jgi:hypothetical protein